MRIAIVNNATDECDKYYYINSRRFIYSKANQYKESVEYININDDDLFTIIDKINDINPDEVYIEYIHIYVDNPEILKCYINLIIEGINCKTVYIPDYEAITDSSYGTFIEFDRYKQIRKGD